MQKRRLGGTDIFLPVIGQGTMNLENSDALKAGLAAGANFIDTAEAYQNGESEKQIGKLIAECRSDVIIGTKVSPENLHYVDIISSCENSLKRLGTDYIDLYSIHWPNPDIELEETLDAFVTLKRQGKIRAIGVSNFSLRQLVQAAAIVGDGEIASNSVEYNYFDRSIEEDLLPYCQEHSISIVAYSPLDQGHLSLPTYKKIALMDIANQYSKTVSQILLNWVIRNKPVVAIPKAGIIRHTLQNAAAADFELAVTDVETLDWTFASTPIYIPPYKLRVVSNGEGNRYAYSTRSEAVENRLHFCPSPTSLARYLRATPDVLKPVRARLSTPLDMNKYDLIEGRIRYWAWVIAFGENFNIPVLVREE